MAKLNPGILFTGSLGGLSAYKMKGSDKIILRTKGGPSKKQVHSMPENCLLRLNNREWSGCVQAGSSIRRSLHGILHLADYNVSGPLNALAKLMQKTDTETQAGKRNIRFSEQAHLLTGFSLNKNVLFDSVVRYPLVSTVERTNGHAQVQLPALEPGIHLQLNNRWPLFRFCLTLGVVSDIVYNDKNKNYEPAASGRLPMALPVTTDWWPASEAFPATLLQVILDEPSLLNEHTCLVMGIGLEMGQPSVHGDIEPVKYAGCGKIIAVA